MRKIQLKDAKAKLLAVVDQATRPPGMESRRRGCSALPIWSACPGCLPSGVLMSYRVNREICRGAIENHGAVLAFNGSERTLR